MDGPWWGEHASQRRQLLRNPYEAAATLRRMSRILVVDDEAAVREALEHALWFEGYEVELAEDGYEALLAVAESPPEAIVLDVMMPRVEGIESVAVSGRQRSHPDLMLTARAAVKDRVVGLDAGADMPRSGAWSSTGSVDLAVVCQELTVVTSTDRRGTAPASQSDIRRLRGARSCPSRARTWRRTPSTRRLARPSRSTCPRAQSGD